MNAVANQLSGFLEPLCWILMNVPVRVTSIGIYRSWIALTRTPTRPSVAGVNAD